jgi:ubiquinone/menaquinone biosynthesis C-methylase UbiE
VAGYPSKKDLESRKMTAQGGEGSVGKAPPYFDILFARLQEHEPATSVAFARHVHWGFWGDPAGADGSADDYAAAAERLCRRVCDAAGIRDGLRVLDVGCGFGGTIASLNERFVHLDMTGVNIDRRQLDRAAATVWLRGGNRVRWVEADACRLPFPAGSFDVVLAVESIFHFPSRAAFFAEAARVLAPEGTMALSDFVPPEKAVPVLRSFNAAADEATVRTYGRIDVLCSLLSYREIAAAAGFAVAREDDVTPHTLPTYPFLRKHLRTWRDAADAALFDQATAQIETACRSGLLRYTILSFRRQAESALRQSA